MASSRGRSNLLVTPLWEVNSMRENILKSLMHESAWLTFINPITFWSSQIMIYVEVHVIVHDILPISTQRKITYRSPWLFPNVHMYNLNIERIISQRNFLHHSTNKHDHPTIIPNHPLIRPAISWGETVAFPKNLLPKCSSLIPEAHLFAGVHCLVTNVSGA